MTECLLWKESVVIITENKEMNAIVFSLENVVISRVAEKGVNNHSKMGSEGRKVYRGIWNEKRGRLAILHIQKSKIM